jgi:KAP family P-loop domain
VTWVLAFTAWLLAPALPSTDAVRRVAGGSVALSTLGLAGAAFARRRKFLAESVEGSFAELVRVPDYGASAGYMHSVHEDMRRVLDLVASEKSPVVVFVDDLDRCSYESVAQVIEAINLFLAGEFPNCIFILAMEPDLVAAQIEVAYKDLFAAVAKDAPARERGSLGWRFLEKMVQLPLSLPPPEPAQVSDLVDSILAPATRDAGPTDQAVADAREQIKQESAGGLEGIVAAAKQMIQTGDRADRATVIRAAEEEFAAQFSDRDADVQKLIREAAGALSRNPREIKRFINVFRFYSFIQVRREVRGLPAPSYEQVAKIAVLAVRWPHLLGYFGQDRDRQETVLALLERLAAREDTDKEGWNKDTLLAEEIAEARCSELLADEELRELLKSQPQVAAKAAGFL